MDMTTHNLPRSYPCDLCPKVCSALAGLARHKKLKHPDIKPPRDLLSHNRVFHPLLNGMLMPLFFFCSYRTAAQPCDEDSVSLQAPWDSTSPLPALPSQDNQCPHDWTPFEDRLVFDWAYHHYVKVQSSTAEIAQELDFWSAIAIKHGSTAGAPWRNAKEMYEAIDSIKIGLLPFKTLAFRYTRPKPSTPLSWMEQEYELNTCDVVEVIWEQLAMSDFTSQINYILYKEFNSKGEQVWSNLMSGHWAFMQAVCPFRFCWFNL